MTKHITRTFFLLLLVLFLNACSTTSSTISNLHNAKDPDKALDFRGYDTVIVNDFKDGVKASGGPDMALEGKKFADIIATSIKSKDIFSEVLRNGKSAKPALLVEGKITEYVEGSAMLRTAIGLGAGSSHFDAKVYVKDNKTSKLLAYVDVDSRSWDAGGIVAGMQDIKHHMDTAASKIASELAKAKSAH